MKESLGKLISIEEASTELGLRPPTLRLCVSMRKVASVKLGRRRLIPRSEIERLIETNLTPAMPERAAR
jgi:excisionase family DNA binding protein